MRKVWLAAGLGAAGLAGYYYLWRIAPPAGDRAFQPVRSYDEAVARIRRLQAAEGEEINPLCRTVLLDHGHATRRVVLILHGYTNCPHQFHQFAPQLHAAGDTVFVPLQPLHGQNNRQPADLGRATPALLTGFLDEVVDIACGLGQELVVLGFSFGGVLAAWAATRRPEIRRALLVSPAFSLRAVPPHLRRLYANVLPRRRDEFRWWDPVLKEQKPGPEHAYLGYSTRGVGALLQMSLLVEQAARQRAPAARSICVAINPSDEVVDNRAALALAELWRQQGTEVELFSFPAEDQLTHDLIDPAQPKQQVDKVYPVLLDLLGTPETP